MKALIAVKRTTEYATVVEMSQETYDSIQAALDGTRTESNAAERELNRLIDVKDWQDDSFDSLESFEPFTD